MRPYTAIALLAAVSGSLALGSGPGTVIRPVALTGDAAPGGGTFAWFDEPRLNAGMVGFTGVIQGPGIGQTNNQGFWMASQNQRWQVARTGQAAPGAAGATIRSLALSDVSICAQSQLFVTLAGAGVSAANATAIYVASPWDLTLAARQGDQVPGLPAGVTIASFGIRSELNSGGAFAAQARLSGPGVSSWMNDAAVIRFSPFNTPSVIARSGDPVPGVTGGVIRGFAGNLDVDSSNRVYFVGGLEVDGTLVSASGAVFGGATISTLSRIATYGEPIASMGGATLASFDSLRVSGSGVVNFTSWLTGGICGQDWLRASCSRGPGGIAVTHRDGAEAVGVPGAIARSSFAESTGTVTAGYSVIEGDQVGWDNDSTVWAVSAGRGELLAREGGPVPGVPGSRCLDFTCGVMMQVGNSGTVAASLPFTTESGGEFRQALIVWTPSGGARTAITTGQAIEARPGVWRIISHFGSSLSLPEFGDQIAVRLFFTDGSMGIFTLEPAARGECPADHNDDGGVDGMDIEAFMLDFESGESAADLNLDGGVDGGDLEEFFRHFEAGC